MLTDAVRAIFKENLGVKKTERVLVFTDRPAKREALGEDELIRRERLLDIANLASDVGAGLAKSVVSLVYPATCSHGKEPPRKLWELAFGQRAVRALDEAGLLRPLLQKRISAQGLAEAEGTVARHKRDAVDAVVALSNYSTTHTTFREFLTRVCGARYASMPLFDVEMLEGAMDVDWRALARLTRGVARLLRRAVEVEIKTRAARP